MSILDGMSIRIINKSLIKDLVKLALCRKQIQNATKGAVGKGSNILAVWLASLTLQYIA